MMRVLMTMLAICVMVGTALTAQPIETPVLPESTYSPGEYTFAPVPLGTAGYTVGYVKIDRAQWLDPGTRVTWTIELSQDSGSTWGVIASGGSSGGVFTNPRTGVVAAFSLISASLPNPSNPNRQLKGAVTVTGGSVTTTVYGGLR